MMHRCMDIRAGLSMGEIHVWTARLFDDDRTTAGLLPILDQEERARAAKLAIDFSISAKLCISASRNTGTIKPRSVETATPTSKYS